jgi:flagellar protein FliS
MNPNPLNVYRQTEVQSRSPLELVVLLYDGALRFLAAAKDGFARGDIPARRQATSRLLAIISELQSTLDVERGGEVAASLDELYSYMTRRIVEATSTNSAAPLEDVQRLLETLREGWQGIAGGPVTSGEVSPAVMAGASQPGHGVAAR